MEKRESSSDEIDLVDLLLKFVLLIKRNFWLIVAFFVVGTGLGYTYSMLAQKQYESKMMVRSDFLTESYVEKLDQLLNNIIIDGNHELLASKLGITPEETGYINSISFEGVRKEKIVSEKQIGEKEVIPFYLFITTRISNPDILPKLEKGIISYLENNPYTKEQVDQKKTFYNKIIKKLDEEMIVLEEFKSRIYKGDFFEKNGGNIMVNPADVNAEIIKMAEDKFTYEKELRDVSAVNLVEGFSRFNKHVSPKKIVSLAAGATFGLFMVALVILFKSVRSLLRKAEENQNQ
ncbi:MAG: hypothetical protein HOP08_07820 [Cyclobacteriaceae bacterium]|nr:hypothetical protein [Cyclobacteriaceae bacterium]